MFNTKNIFIDFFAKHFLENIGNKLFLVEEFDFW